jgi:hypothetical protein
MTEQMSEGLAEQSDLGKLREELVRGPAPTPRAPRSPLPVKRIAGLLFSLVQKTWGAIYLVLAVIAIFGFCYALGHTQLEGPLSGNDIPWALSQAQWYDRWYPDLPIWYPNQAAGTPLFYLYQPGPSLLATLISRLGALTIIQAFRLLGFLSVPITALGVYFFVWRKTKSQTVALVAALFYPMSPAAWYWLVRVGLYAQCVTIMFVPWALLAFDMCLDGMAGTAKPTQRRWRGLAFLLAAALFGLMLIHHIPTALIFLMGISVYAFLHPLFRARENDFVVSMVSSVVRSWSIALAGLLLVAFWLLPFQQSNALANREGLSYIPPAQVSSYDMLSVLSLDPAGDSAVPMTFPILFVALAAVGILFGLLLRESPAVWGLIAFGSVLFVAMPRLWMDIVERFGLLWSATNDRAILIAFVMLPAAAAYGASALPRLIASIPGVVAKVIMRKPGNSNAMPPALSLLKNSIAALLTLGVAGAAVIYGPIIAPERTDYAPLDGDEPLPFALQDGRLVFHTTPERKLSSEGLPEYSQVLPEIAELLGFDSLARLDVSPNLGWITQSLSLYSDASIINIYAFNASLFHAMWSYQSSVFYSPGIGTTHELNQLAKWFGIKFVILQDDLYPSAIYPADSWPIVYPTEGEAPHNILVRRFNEAPEMVSLLATPTILVIGGFEDAIYEQAFKTFVKGALGYDEGLVVEGAHLIDDYTIEDLRDFDVIFLHGYGYSDREAAWQLIETYVTEGGTLFVDTGWQYFAPDWETSNAPVVLPVNALEWTSLGMTDDYVVEDAVVTAGADSNAFAKLIWEDLPWGLSVPLGGLRSWARPIITVRDTPIIAAGELGAGRVVWSGMNLVGHSLAFDNAAERDLLRALIAWLAPVPEETNLPTPEVIRDHPDHVRFLLQKPTQGPTSLLWREAYSPNWQARLIVDGHEESIPTYRAGPGLTLLRLPQIDTSGAEIRLDYSLGWIGIVGPALSIVTLVALVIRAVNPDIGKRVSTGEHDTGLKDTPQGTVAWMPDQDPNEVFPDSTGAGATGADEPAWMPVSDPSEVLPESPRGGAIRTDEPAWMPDSEPSEDWPESPKPLEPQIGGAIIADDLPSWVSDLDPDEDDPESSGGGATSPDELPPPYHGGGRKR